MTRLFDKPVSCTPHPVEPKEGVYRRYQFPNGFGLSVVRFKLPFRGIIPGIVENEYGSYTNNEKEWECAVTYEGHLCYDTPITSDVLGYQTEDDVEKVLQELAKYPVRGWGQKFYFLFKEWYRNVVGDKFFYWEFKLKRLYRKITNQQKSWEK